MTTPLPTPAKNFFDYPAKERKEIIKKATEESNQKQAELMKKPTPAKESKKNCSCKSPKPTGNFEVGKYEGRFRRCKNCLGRIWS